MKTERILAAEIREDAKAYERADCTGTYDYRLRVQAASDAEAVERIASADPALAAEMVKHRFKQWWNDASEADRRGMVEEAQIWLRALASVLGETNAE